MGGWRGSPQCGLDPPRIFLEKTQCDKFAIRSVCTSTINRYTHTCIYIYIYNVDYIYVYIYIYMSQRLYLLCESPIVLHVSRVRAVPDEPSAGIARLEALPLWRRANL